jgi:hypothetical protein
MHGPRHETSADGGGGSKNEPGARFAARIEAMLASIKETSYQATTEIDESSGSVKCDCSDLVGFIYTAQ